MLFRPAVSEKYVTPSSLRRTSFQNDIQCSAYFPSSASNAATSPARFVGAGSVTNASSGSGVGRSPQTSRETRRANTASETAVGGETFRATRYLATSRSSGEAHAGHSALGIAGRVSARGAAHGWGAG